MLLREYWLNRISLFCAVLGMLVLLGYSITESPKKLSSSKLNDEFIGAKVKTEGLITSSKITDRVALFTLGNTPRTHCVFFNPSARERIILTKNNFVEVVGRVKKYRGRIEIVAELVKLLD